jgi:hypothetical protein
LAAIWAIFRFEYRPVTSTPVISTTFASARSYDAARSLMGAAPASQRLRGLSGRRLPVARGFASRGDVTESNEAQFEF